MATWSLPVVVVVTVGELGGRVEVVVKVVVLMAVVVFGFAVTVVTGVEVVFSVTVAVVFVVVIVVDGTGLTEDFASLVLQVEAVLVVEAAKASRAKLPKVRSTQVLTHILKAKFETEIVFFRSRKGNA